MGSKKMRADVALLTEDDKPLILCEIKQGLNEESADQLKSYMRLTDTPYGVLVSAETHKGFLLRERAPIDLLDLSQLRVLFDSRAVLSEEVSSEADAKPQPTDAKLPADATSSVPLLDSVIRIGKSRYCVSMKNQTITLTYRQLYKFRAFHQVLSDHDIYVPSTVSSKHWDVYLREKLEESRGIGEATSQLLAMQDPITEFIAAKCVRDPKREITRKDLYGAYQAWCYETAAKPMSARRFVPAIRKELGIDERKSNATLFWTGIRLTSDRLGDLPSNVDS
jgi:hypothetical protein